MGELIQQLDLLQSQADATCALGEEKQRAKRRALALARQKRKMAIREKEARLLAQQLRSGGNLENTAGYTGLRNRLSGAGRGPTTPLSSAAASASTSKKGGGANVSDGSSGNPLHSSQQRSSTGGGLMGADSTLSLSFVEQVDRDLLTIRQENEYAAARSSIDLGMYMYIDQPRGME